VAFLLNPKPLILLAAYFLDWAPDGWIGLGYASLVPAFCLAG
jgi:hypothetical protein